MYMARSLRLTAIRRLSLALCMLVAAVAAEAANGAVIEVAGSAVPGSMAAGSTAAVRVRVRNTGTTTWTAGSLHRLGALATNGFTWGAFPCGGYATSPTNARVYLCSNVPPGATYDFNFQITAPSAPGTVPFAVRMVQDAVEWFGQSYAWNVTVTGPSLPDVVVDTVSLSPSNPSVGQAVTFSAVVRNAGTASTPSGVVIGVGYRIDGAQVSWGVVNGPLAPGASVTVGTHAGGAWTATAGTHTLMAVADDVNRFAESNEGNNTRSISFTVSSNALPDVVVDTVSLSPSNPSAGQAVTFSAVVRNAGNASTPSGVVIGVGYRIDGAQVSWGAVNGPLAPGASVTVGTHAGGAWTATAGTHTLMAVADDVNRFAESNEGNNTRSISFTVTGTGACPAGTFDIGDYVLGDRTGSRVYVNNSRGQTETFAYLPGGVVAGLNQHFFVKNDSGENWEEFGLDSSFVYRHRDTSWTDRCTNPDAEAYYEVVDNNRTSFAKWAPRCMTVGQNWTSNVGSQVKAHFERINNCAECSSQYEGPTWQHMTLVAHHPTYTTMWGLAIPNVVELYTASSTDRFFYSREYGLVAFVGPDPAGGEFRMGAYAIDANGHNPPNRVPLCGGAAGFIGLAGYRTVADYRYEQESWQVSGAGSVHHDGDAASLVPEGGDAPGLLQGVQVEAMVRRESNVTEDGIAGRWDGEGQWRLGFVGEGTSVLEFVVRLEDGTSASLRYALPDDRYLGTTVHVAASYDMERGMRLFWNGGLVASSKTGGKRLAATASPIRVGDAGDPTSRFDGRITKVTISAPAVASPGGVR